MPLRSSPSLPAAASVPGDGRARQTALCALALLLSLATLLGHQQLQLQLPMADRVLVILFMLPILASAMVGGLLPGLVATAASTLCTGWLLLPPGGSGSASQVDLLHGALLVVSGVLASAGSEGWRRSRRRERRYWQQEMESTRQLLDSQAQLQAIFEQAGMGIGLVDVNSKLLRVNQRLAEILGYRDDELMALSLRDITHPDDIAATRAAVQRVLAGDAAGFRLEKRYRRRDGQMVWVNLISRLMRDEQGLPRYFVSVVDDIQARKNAEAERDLFSEAFQQASQPLLMTDGDFKIRYVNPAFVDLMGHGLSELLGQSIGRLSPDSEPAAAALAELLAQLRSQGHYSGEVEGLAKDGTAMPLALNVNPVRDAAGSTVAWVASLFDLRPMREKDVLLHKLALALEQSPSEVLICTLDLEIEYVNDAVVKNSGYRRDELLGMSMRQLLAPLQAPGLHQALADALRDGHSWSGVLIQRRRDGHDYPLAANLLPMVQADGRVSNLIAVGQDISERLHVDAELAQHRDHLEALVAQRTAALDAANASLAQQQRFVRTVADAVPGLVGYVDAQSRYRFTNAGYAAWYGVPAEQLLGRTVREVAGEALHIEAAPRIAAALRGELQRFQRTFTRHDGSVRHALSTLIPDCDEQGVRGFFTMASDITELKEAELKLSALNAELAVRAEQAEAATRAKSAFLANMSHEIRTPMNAIIGLSHLMVREARDAQQLERLAKIEGAAKHLLKVINDILELSKIEAGKLTLETADFSLDCLLAHCVSLVSDEAGAKGLSLTVDSGGLPPWLCGDATRLSQALVNLLANAVKFTDVGGVQLRGQLLREHGGRLQLRFEVSDSGPGIDAQSQARLFNPFEQLDSTATRRHGGSGLGLALTRRLVNLMGGDIGVVSAPGQGSCFWFTVWLTSAAQPGPVEGAHALAADAAAQQAVQAESLLRQRHAGQRVLLAEDNPINQEVAGELLRLAGLQVDLADDGQQAVDLACRGAYDLVLMDMQMPVLDGLDAAREIRRRLGEQLPIVAMTANAFDEDREVCLAAGMNDHVPKPVDPVLLYETLLRWLPRADGGPASVSAAPSAGSAAGSAAG